MKRTILPVVIYLWFYVGWFACLWCARHEVSLYALAAPVISWILLHLMMPLHKRLVTYMLGVFAIGVLFDVLMINLGIVSVVPEFQGLVPAWLIAMWLMYVAALPQSTRLFEKRLWLAAIMGGLMGPLSYKYGDLAGVITLNHDWSLYAYSAFWMIYFPLSVETKKKYLGAAHQKTTPASVV